MVDPEHAALLVIDMQNFFQRIVRPILKNLLTVIETCRKKMSRSFSPSTATPTHGQMVVSLRNGGAR